MTPSPKILLKLTSRLKNELKKSDTYQEMCNKFDASPDFIDLVPVKFGDINVSAETNAGVITLANSLLKEADLTRMLGLLLHELQHYLSQCQEPTQSADEGDYLANPDEVAAFQTQLQYIDEEQGKEKAEDYAQQVLDHHGVKNKKERAKKEENLLKLIED